MINYQDRWAVVTGASSGLGRGLAVRLADMIQITDTQLGSISFTSVYTTRVFWERLWRTAGIQFVGLFNNPGTSSK